MRRHRLVIGCAAFAAFLVAPRPGAAPGQTGPGGDEPFPPEQLAPGDADGPAGDFQAENVAEMERRREQLRVGAERVQANLPLLAARHVDEVMRVRLEGGNFVIRTPLPATAGQGYVRALVAEVARPVLVRVVRNPAAPASPASPVVPDEFILQVDDYTQPRRVASLALNQTGTSLLSLFYTEQAPAGTRTIHFMAQKHPLLPGGGTADLTVNEPSPSPGTPPRPVRLTAPDAATFVRHYRDATNKYLRPLFASLGQEAVFAPDPLVAAQVFPDSRPPDEATRRGVEQLLPGLGAADYRRRDEATAALQALGRGAAVALLHLDQSKLTPEQRMRIEGVLIPLGPLPAAEAKRLRSDATFLLDCQYADDPATRRAAAAALKVVLGGAGIVDPEAPAAVRAVAVARVRRGLAAGQ